MPQVCTLPARAIWEGRPAAVLPDPRGWGTITSRLGLAWFFSLSSPLPTGAEAHPDPWLYPAARAGVGDAGHQDLGGPTGLQRRQARPPGGVRALTWWEGTLGPG